MNFLEKLSQAFTPILTDGLDFGVKFLVGLIVLIIGYFIAKLISNAVRKFIDILNLESYMDKLREVDLFAGITISLSQLVSRLLFWVLMFATIMVSLDIMGLDMISNGINNALAYLPRIVSALVFFVIATFLANGAKMLVDNACSSMGIASGKMLSNILFYFFLLMIAIVSLNQAGIATDMITENFQIILALGMLGLALGFGLGSRDLFSNMLGSYYSSDKFKVGQVVEFDNLHGEIMAIDSTSITLNLGDKKMIVPLKNITNSTVIIHK